MNNIAILVGRKLEQVNSITIYCDILMPSEIQALKERFEVEDLGLGNYRFTKKNAKK